MLTKENSTSYLKDLTAFETIWHHVPELQNWSSSSWWFFLFMPKQEEGFGPKQMMFTYASRVGKGIRVSTDPSRANDNWQPGIKLPRKVTNGIDKFWTTVVGWINDGNQVHEEIVHEPALATLNAEGYLEAWTKEGYGARIESYPEKKHGIKGYFKGRNGSADFIIWSEKEDLIHAPRVSDIRTKFGGTHLVAWPKFRFKGTFMSPSGTEELEGIGYFQRVCMNIPMFPWKWIYTVFEDGSVFSSFGPYIGLQILRRNNWWFPSFIESATKNIFNTGYFYNNKTGETTQFQKISVNAFVNSSPNPVFTVSAKNKKGDFIEFLAKSHGRAQFLLDKSILGGIWHSRLNYNEFMFKVEGLKGSINNQPVTKETFGQGWGNHEYTWNFSL